MRTAKVVIGANWGDEGKGLLTDYLATADSTIIRFNGGAQAGHTVVRDGRRHVFHHFGSGTLKGASTYLSRFFISNPILYFRELEALDGLSPRVMVDARGLVTTPFDMMINQMVEQARGAGRHGSCGVGINETIKRSEAGFSILVDDLDRSTLAGMLRDIRTEWVPARLIELGIVASDEWQQRLASDDILNVFVDYCLAYRQQVAIRSLAECENLLFEGAQGLLLDEDHHFFPHVTHSHTGLHNVVALAAEAGIDGLDVTYATRGYATRHGAGPFPREVPGLSYQDTTNVTNDWQGQLRFGLLDLDLLAESIRHDLKHATLPVRYGLAVTCLDQMGDMVTFWQGDERRTARDDMVRRACKSVGAAFCLTSFGPTAADVGEFNFASAEMVA